MSSVQSKQSLKLHVLAFVLAMALLWYSLNPVPSPLTGRKREDELPDEKKREVEPASRQPTILPLKLGAFRAQLGTVITSLQDEDDFEWPDYIDA